ncbi:SUN domain-containing protein 1 [Lampris incognitus]|uniref:SUN domain-containing protein 1 n=1 Tax=Lampris incognitus TaxID=2546036 RepID=UPI0024B4EF44|nr:SUN domain-containing protein 1 [Lampris incognitus]
MSRRSARLVSSSYYQSDGDSDSSSVTNISYRESPVTVFKKKTGGRKAASRTSSRANSTAGAEQIAAAEQCDDGLSQTSQTMRTVPYATTATPRPALTSTCLLPDPPETSPPAGLHGATRTGCHYSSYLQFTQSSIDSSGYSSSEGPHTRATANTARTSRTSSTSGYPITGHSNRNGGPGYLSHINSIASRVAAAQSSIMLLIARANASFGTGAKKACGLLLFIALVALGIWLLIPLLASVKPRSASMKTPSLTAPTITPVPPASPPLPQPNTIPPAPVVDPAVVYAAFNEKMKSLLEEVQQKKEILFSQDPAVVYAAVNEKMKILLGELQLKQEKLFSQMEERVQRNMQGLTARIETVDSDIRLHVDREMAALRRQVADYHTDSLSATASLNHRLQAVEGENVKLSQELLSIRMEPPAPPADLSIAPQPLTPELQEALEKWFTDRFKEQGLDRLGGKESCSDCKQPMADKMADFALESQGASVVSTKCSETYRIRSACVTLFGFPLWYPSESPRTVIQGFATLLPGKCWAFHGAQGTLVISLSHPVKISHVTLDHLPLYKSPTGRMDSAPKDFEVYGTVDDSDEGTLLGKFTYDQDGESTQTFELPNPTDVVYRFVELGILSNWGHMEYTCVYRFRVHGKIASA